jgi:hypothetical protein
MVAVPDGSAHPDYEPSAGFVHGVCPAAAHGIIALNQVSVFTQSA